MVGAINRSRARGRCVVARCVVAALAVSLGLACISNPRPPRPAAASHRIQLPSGVGVYAHAEAARPAGSDRPVVLVPGAAWLERDLSIPGWPTIYADLPGRGQADPTDPVAASIEGDLEALEALRARLGLERIVFLGWGYYGGLAVRYALRHPERVAGLVLVSPLPPRREPHWEDFVARAQLRTDPRVLERLAAARTSGAKGRRPYEFCREFTRLFVDSRTVDPAGVLSRMRSEPCVSPNLDPDVGAALGGAIVRQLGDWDWRHDVTRVAAPTLIVHGRADTYPFEGSEEYAATIPGAQLALIDDCGHLPWLERPEAFEAELVQFLAVLEP